jgi:hypothetical protein
MAYQCPRCGEAVQRGTSRMAGMGGAVGALLYSAFGSFQCKKCGTIPKSEFPHEVRTRMALGSLTMVLVAILLLAALITLLVFVIPRQ